MEKCGIPHFGSNRHENECVEDATVWIGTSGGRYRAREPSESPRLQLERQGWLINECCAASIRITHRFRNGGLLPAKPATAHTKPTTTAGKEYMAALTEWLQDSRLMSEGISRLFGDYQTKGQIQFSATSWPKKKAGSIAMSEFAISPADLGVRMKGLLNSLWAGRFVFLETLWEEYLEELAKEIRHRDASLFEPFCDKDFMADIVREVILGSLASVDDIKDEVATRFAAGLTRQSFSQQWNQLKRLQLGLNDDAKSEPWFGKLEAYFEMRNCLIHRQGRVSKQLEKLDSYFASSGYSRIAIYPAHLDFYRHQFISCLLYIETRWAAKLAAH